MLLKSSIFLLLFFLALFHPIVAQSPELMVIQNPSANLYLDPHDAVGDTQLLYGERVNVLKEKNDWLYVATELPIVGLLSGKWEGFEGWIRKDCAIPNKTLPKNNVVVQIPYCYVYQRPSQQTNVIKRLFFGTILSAIRLNKKWWKVALVDGTNGYVYSENLFELSSLTSTRCIRNRLKKLSSIFINVDYGFGKRGIDSVNCSGLVNLLYRACGLPIPLKAHDQFLMTKRIEAEELQTGDLVFIQWKNIKRMKHVLLYLGNEMLLEATLRDNKKVRIIDACKRFGCPLHSLKNGDTYGSTEKKIFFGSLLI